MFTHSYAVMDLRILCRITVSDFIITGKMDKIIINLEIPAISERYDVWVNPEMEVGVLTNLLSKVVEDASNHSYVSSGSEILCLADDYLVLKPNMQLLRYDVGNGDRLIMF